MCADFFFFLITFFKKRKKNKCPKWENRIKNEKKNVQK